MEVPAFALRRDGLHRSGVILILEKKEHDGQMTFDVRILNLLQHLDVVQSLQYHDTLDSCLKG